jgi:hypothetical protein
MLGLKVSRTKGFAEGLMVSNESEDWGLGGSESEVITPWISCFGETREKVKKNQS